MQWLFPNPAGGRGLPRYIKQPLFEGIAPDTFEEASAETDADNDIEHFAESFVGPQEMASEP
jgi:hypothetical protein